MKTQKFRLSRIVMNFLLLVYAVFAIFPLIWMLLISFKSDTEVFTTTFLFHPTLSNYTAVLLESNYVQYMKDSLIVAGGSVLVSVVVGIPAAYALARYNFNRKEDLAFQILSFKFAPEILVVLPLFMIYQKIGLYDTYLGLIWVYQLICMPLLIWVVRGYFEDISVEIEYAAQVDGYTWYQIFFKMLMPLVKPGIVAAALLSFIFAWNSWDRSSPTRAIMAVGISSLMLMFTMMGSEASSGRLTRSNCSRSLVAAMSRSVPSR